MTELRRVIREAWWLLLFMLVLFVLSCVVPDNVRETLWLARIRDIAP